MASLYEPDPDRIDRIHAGLRRRRIGCGPIDRRQEEFDLIDRHGAYVFVPADGTGIALIVPDTGRNLIFEECDDIAAELIAHTIRAVNRQPPSMETTS